MAAGLGFKTFTTGEVLSAANVNGYLMQGVLVFASAAARDAAITSPQEGQFAYLKDTNVTTYYTGSAWANLDTTGMTNPMTTTGDTIYSSSGSTPARLGIGSTGQVLTVAAGLPSWATAAGGGKVLQVVEGRTSTSASNSTTTYADTGVTATITPSSVSSKILVLISIGAWFKDETSLTESIQFNCMRSATQIQESGTFGFLRSGSLLIGAAGGYAFHLLDTPATTSATTYKVQFKLGAGTGAVYVQDGSKLSTIVLMEIGA